MAPVDGVLETYVPWPRLVVGPLRDAPRAQAEAFFAWFLQARQERLRQLVAAIPEAARDASVEDAQQPLRVAQAVLPILRRATFAAYGDLRAPALSALVGDLGIWLGERICAAAPVVHWALSTSHKKALGYQRPVLMGFVSLDPHYYVDVGFFVASWAELAARGRRADPGFLSEIEASALADARGGKPPMLSVVRP